MKKMEEIPDGHVLTCTVTECSYNQKEICFAPNINVGAGHPTCDTFTTQSMNRAPQGMPDVSVCNINECSFNLNNDCNAPGITVAHHSNHADCLTYRPAM